MHRTLKMLLLSNFVSFLYMRQHFNRYSIICTRPNILTGTVLYALDQTVPPLYPSKKITFLSKFDLHLIFNYELIRKYLS